MANAIVQTREVVAIVPVNRTIANWSIPSVQPGGQVDVYFENITTTDGAFGNLSEIATPLQTNALYDDYNRVFPTSGNLINVICTADIPGVELQFYEAYNNDLFWRISDQVLVTPGLTTFVRAVRFIGHFGLVSVYNGGATNAAVGLMVRASTM